MSRATASARELVLVTGASGYTGGRLVPRLVEALTVLRAAMIIGSGSASFEILRYLVEPLPVMVTPRWVSTESQPIAVRNVIEYLALCLAVPETKGRTLDIGGTDIVSYRDLMRIMAEELGLRARLCGGSAAPSTGSWAGRACGAGGAIPRRWATGKPSTSGGSPPSSATAAWRCGRR